MKKESDFDFDDHNEFTIDSLRKNLTSLRRDLRDITDRNKAILFIDSLTDSDFILMFSEWIYRRKTMDIVSQTGFIFEILGQRHIKTIEKNSELGELVRQTVMFLNQSKNNNRMWNSERSNPDDVGILETKDVIYINRVYESKISLHALHRSKGQRIQSMITIGMVVNALNGSDHKIKSKAGWKVLTESMEYLFDHCGFPIEMSPDCEYCYILPHDQIYRQSRYEPRQFEVINIPLDTTEIDRFRVLTVNYFLNSSGNSQFKI